MISITLIVLSAVINRLRGMSFDSKILSLVTSKYVMAIAMGLMFGISSWSIAIGLIVAFGWALWSAFGWGEYWDFTDNKNDEVQPIDWLVSKIVKPGHYNDLLSMTIRGAIGYWSFVALSVALSSPVPLIAGLLLLSQGFVYYLFRYELGKIISIGRSHTVTEVVMGLIWGGALTWSIIWAQ